MSTPEESESPASAVAVANDTKLRPEPARSLAPRPAPSPAAGRPRVQPRVQPAGRRRAQPPAQPAGRRRARSAGRRVQPAGRAPSPTSAGRRRARSAGRPSRERPGAASPLADPALAAAGVARRHRRGRDRAVLLLSVRLADPAGHLRRRVERAAGLGHAARQPAAARLDRHRRLVLHHRAPRVHAGGSGPRAERGRAARVGGDQLHAGRADRRAAGPGTRDGP